MSESRARYGWESDFPEFSSVQPSVVRERLESFVTDASLEQVRAWRDSIPPLQREVDEVLVRDVLAKHYSAILEYELPLESRRPDVLLLIGSGVMVIELKGKQQPSQADIDQAAAYARDLRCYHRECSNRSVVPVLVPTRAHGYLRQESGVHVAGPDALDGLIAQITALGSGPPITRDQFLAESAYRPLPTLVEAARELFQSGELRTIHRARAATDPAVKTITRIIHQAAATRSRHLILLTGVPGAGKTLVGLRTVHAHYLDDLAIPRGDGKPTAPAVFLSGNGAPEPAVPELLGLPPPTAARRGVAVRASGSRRWREDLRTRRERLRTRLLVPARAGAAGARACVRRGPARIRRRDGPCQAP